MSNKLDHKQAASLKQILEKSKLLNNKILEKELPSLERGLEQIDTQTKQLSTRSVHDEAKDIHAYDKLLYILFVTYIIVRHFFLAQGGVDTQVLIKELGTVHLGPSTEHRQAILDTDIEVNFEVKKYTYIS